MTVQGRGWRYLPWLKTKDRCREKNEKKEKRSLSRATTVATVLVVDLEDHRTQQTSLD